MLSIGSRSFPRKVDGDPGESCGGTPARPGDEAGELPADLWLPVCDRLRRNDGANRLIVPLGDAVGVRKGWPGEGGKAPGRADPDGLVAASGSPSVAA